MKHVFNTEEIAHLWAHKTQSDARNAQGNFYFDGDTIYSYGRHFSIARHVTNKQGQAAILFTARDYSVTTARHVNMVRQAIPDGPVFEVNRPEHGPLLDYYRERLKACLDATSKPRIRDTTRVHSFRQAEQAVADGNAMAEFFGLRDRLTLPDTETLRQLREASAEVDATRKREDRARAEKQAEAERLYLIEHEQCFDHWRKTGLKSHVCGCENSGRFVEWNPRRVLLRATADEVITSQGATVPLDHAARLWPILKKLHDKGETYRQNGHTIHIGHYAVNSFDGATMRAGCHVITWDEMQKLAVSLGWEVRA